MGFCLSKVFTLSHNRRERAVNKHLIILYDKEKKCF